MKTKKHNGEKDSLYSYSNHINRDSWFLKGQLTFALVFLVVLLIYFIFSA